MGIVRVLVMRVVAAVPVSVIMSVPVRVPVRVIVPAAVRSGFRIPATAMPAHVPMIVKPLRHRHGEQVARQKNEGGKFPRDEHDRDSAQQIALEGITPCSLRGARCRFNSSFPEPNPQISRDLPDAADRCENSRWKRRGTGENFPPRSRADAARGTRFV